MPIVDGISKTIAGLPSSPGFDRLMNKISNPAPNNVAPYLIPEGAVITGRSTFSWLRNGFLEFQERFLEESIVAAFWFWGVGWMEKIYDKFLKPKFLDLNVDWGFAKKKGVALTPGERYSFDHEGWKKILRGKGRKLLFSVGSTLAIVGLVIPFLNREKTEWILKTFYGEESSRNKQVQPKPKPESKIPNHPEPRQLNPLRAVRPERNPGMHGLLPNQNPAWTTPSGFNALPPDENPAWTSSSYPSFYPPYPLGSLYPTYYQQPIYQQQGVLPASPIRFGLSGGTMLQAVGHGIQNTDVGRMLSIDAGITGGRAAFAMQYSGFESAEIIFRDGVSLYFYILAVPHVMKLLNRVINPCLAASILLDPGVAKHLNEKIAQNPILQEALKAGNLSSQQMETVLKEVFYGYENDAIRKFPKGWLQQEMRSAPLQGSRGLAEILPKEYRVLLGDAGAKYSDAVLKSLSGSQVSVEEVHRIIGQIAKGEGTFAELEKSARANLISGLKHAFGSIVGVSVDDLRTNAMFKEMLANLPKAQAEALEARLKEMAAQDGRDLANQLYRRSLNVGRHHMGESHALIQKAELLSTWLEKAASYHMDPEKLIPEEARKILETLEEKQINLTSQQQAALKKLKDSAVIGKEDLRALSSLQEAIQGNRQLSSVSAPLEKLRLILRENTPLRKLLRVNTNEMLNALKQEVTQKSAGSVELMAHYRHALDEVFNGRHRLFSLALDEVDTVSPELTRKIRELLNGGAVHDSKLMTEALRMTHALGEDARSVVSSSKTTNMHGAVKDYLDTMLRHITEKKAATRWSQDVFSDFARYFLNLCKNSSYLSRWAGLGFAVLGLGILVPKLQYALTRRLTGKDEHPGIAEVARRAGINPGQFENVPGDSNAIVADNALLSGPPLRRNGFSAFRQQAV